MLSPSMESERPTRVNGLVLGGALIVIVVLYVAAYALGGELWQIMAAGLQTIPFTILALLAYLGIDRDWAKALTLLWLAALVGLTGLVGVLLSFAILADLPLGAANVGSFSLNLAGDDAFRLVSILVASIVAVGVAALGFLPAVRRRLSRILPIDPASFVHMVALVAVVAFTLLDIVPLIILGAPPLLTLVADATQQGANFASGDASGQLRSTVYGLIWTMPGTILAVGYTVRRSLREALTRLGLVRPTLRQVLVGIGAAVLLAAGAQILGYAIDQLWGALGWPKTDNEAFSELLAFAFSPLGAVIIGVTAGLGEESALRGVLQPRLGILLSNLFFTSLHAFQYNWDSMLVVFLVGTALGLIRKRTNTTTSAITHGLYNFILIMLTVLFPGAQ